jgi:cell division protein FtsI (penicillin-binding protein 3)
MLAAASGPTREDAPSENEGDLNAMFEQANSLPADDPLRTMNSAPASAAAQGAADLGAHPAAPAQATRILGLLPARVVAEFAKEDAGSATKAGAAAKPMQPSIVAPPIDPRPSGSVMVDAGQRVAVPSFTGTALRAAVETAEGLGLRVSPVGNGVAREQMPAAGTMVPVGTQVVVRFER